MRARQPADLDLTLYFDFQPVMPARGYTSFEANVAWLDRGEWRGSWLRETKAGAALTDLALTPPGDLDKARWQLVARPVGEERVLASLLFSDLDADFGWMEGSARDTVQCYGDTYTSMLQGVVITPDPAVAASTTSVGSWAAPEVDVRTGPAETVLLGLIADHFGPAAPVPGNRFARLNIPASQGRGATVTIGRRFPTLLDEARLICQEGGITVRLEQGAPGVVDVVITEQQDRPEVTLSRDRNTLQGWRVRGSTARVSRLLVAGKGEGVERGFTDVAAPAPVGGWAFPRRGLVNATSEDQLEPMRRVAREELAELNRPLGVSLRPSPTSPFVPGVHFDLGDRLVVTEGAALVPARVEEISIRHGASSAPEITAQAGQSATSWLAPKFNQLARALRRDQSR